MAWTNPDAPNLPDFLTFLTESVQIPASALPANSPYPQYALNGAIGLVLNPPCNPAPVLYTVAVYNCATHLLIWMTPDQPGQTWFESARGAEGYGLVQPGTGLVVSTNDQGTGTTLAQPKWADGLTPNQLAFYRTPWGREYLSWNASYGPTIVGLT